MEKEVKYDEVYRFVHDELRKEVVQENWMNKFLENVKKGKFTMRAYNVIVEKRVSNKMVTIEEIMKLYNDFKELSDDRLIVWYDQELRKFYSLAYILDDINKKYPKVEKDILEKLVKKYSHLDMASTYHMVCEELRKEK